MISQQKNVLGYDLEYCGTDPITGFYRDGCCNTGPGDVARIRYALFLQPNFYITRLLEVMILKRPG